jgi:hypothetical protein
MYVAVHWNLLKYYLVVKWTATFELALLYKHLTLCYDKWHKAIKIPALNYNTVLSLSYLWFVLSFPRGQTDDSVGISFYHVVALPFPSIRDGIVLKYNHSSSYVGLQNYHRI